MVLCTLETSFLGNILTEKGKLRAGYGKRNVKSWL